MPDNVKAYIEASDNANDFNDKQIEDLKQKALEDIDDLYNDVGNRDDELWNEFDTNPELTVSNYEVVETDDRDLSWALGMAAISAAASAQFFLDNRKQTIMIPLAYREQVLDSFSLSKQELIAAGMRGVEIEGVQKFVALQAKYLDDVSFLTDLSNTELYNALVERGAMLPFDKQVTRASQYVSRMTDYKPGSPQFKEAVADLINADSGTNLKAMNRRAVERIYSERESGGSEKTLMVWIAEGGNTCSYCLDRAGDVRTYGQWIEDGLPGAEVCKGGDRCRCHLAAV